MIAFKVVSGSELKILSLRIGKVRLENARFETGLKLLQLSWNNYKKSAFLLYLPNGVVIPRSFLSAGRTLKKLSKNWRCGVARKPFVFELLWRSPHDIRVQSKTRFSKTAAILRSDEPIRERRFSQRRM